jgi:predicted transcriptional regulator
VAKKDTISIEWTMPEPKITKTVLVRVDSKLHEKADEIRKAHKHKWTEIMESALDAYIRAYSNKK